MKYFSPDKTLPKVSYKIQISLFICKAQYSSEHTALETSRRRNRFNDRFCSLSSLCLFIGHGLLFEAIMEIRLRHIGSQEHSGLPALLSSPFRDAAFLWQLANAFPSFCDDGNRAAEHYRVHPGLRNYIQLPKFCIFPRRITTRAVPP